MFLIIILVWGIVVSGAVQTRLGQIKMYEYLRMTVLRQYHEDDTSAGMKSTIGYTFPKEINCYSVTMDASIFSEQMFILFQALKTSPVTIDDENNKTGCRGFLLFARDLVSFKKALVKLPRWSIHRVYGLIEEAVTADINSMLEHESHLLGDAEMTLFVFGKWSSGFKIGQPIRKVERLGHLTASSDDIWTINFDGFGRFHGRELRFTTGNCSKFSAVSEDGDMAKFGGVDWKVIRETARRMNLTLKYVKPPPGSLYGQLVNGTWQGGIMGTVYQGHADVAFCGITIESNKIDTGVQISSPVQRMCINYLIPRPKRAKENWYAVFSPFSGSLLLVLGLTVLAVSCALNLTALAMKGLLNHRELIYESRINALTVVYGMFLLGSWPKYKKNQGPVNHVLTGWVAFALFVTTSFSSTLFSHLAKPKFSQIPESIKDLVDLGYTWTVSEPFPVKRFFNMDDPAVKKWASQLEVIPDQNERLSILKNSDKTVIIGAEIWGVFIPYYRQPIPGDVLERFEAMDACLVEIFEGFIFRRGSPFNKDFSFYINQLRETGLVEKYGRSVVEEAVTKNPALGRLKMSVTSIPTIAQPLSLSQIRGAFALLLAGNFVSLAIFFGELIFPNRWYKPC